MQINIYRTDFLELINEKDKLKDKYKDFKDILETLSYNNISMLNDTSLTDNTNNQILDKLTGNIEI